MKFLAAICLVLTIVGAYSSVIPISGTSLITSQPGLVVSGHAVAAPVVVAAPIAHLVPAPPAKSIAIQASVVPANVVVSHPGVVLGHQQVIVGH